MRRHWVALGAILALAAFLRIGPTLSESVWADEMFTRRIMHLPPAEALRAIRFDFVHPPAYYLVERVFVMGLGDDLVGLRLLSLLSSLALVLSGALFARALTGGSLWATLSTATLLAVSDMQIEHAYNARSYALYALEIILAAWAAYRLLLDPDSRGARLAFAALATAAITTHYLAAFYLAALGLVGVVTRPTWRSLRLWIALLAPAAVAATAWWVYLHVGTEPTVELKGLRWIADPSWEAVRDAVGHLLGVPSSLKGLGFAAGFTCLAGYIAVRHRDCRVPVTGPGMTLVGTLVVGPALMMLVVSILGPQSVWVDRQLLPTQAFVAIAMGVGVAVIANHHRGMAVAAVLGLVVLNDPGPILGPAVPHRPPYNRVAADWTANRHQSEPILGGDPVSLVSLNYYLRGPDTGRRIPPQSHLRGGWGWAYPPVSDSGLSGLPAIWLVSRTEYQAERDSLSREGWRVDTTFWYPSAERWQAPVSQIRLDRLRKP